MQTMKLGKSPGNDELMIEMLKAELEKMMGKITRVTNKVYSTRIIPEEMGKLFFIATLKKAKAVECSTEHLT